MPTPGYWPRRVRRRRERGESRPVLADQPDRRHPATGLVCLAASVRARLCDGVNVAVTALIQRCCPTHGDLTRRHLSKASPGATIKSVAGDLGVNTETLRNWIRAADGRRP
ncbi:transposase, partial [Streptomyces sp. NPDC102437]|uniref:transposase n=1 Tax=Streptomyces sp. NPDC102437 TaxID=3366175 RepID=UPI00382898F3